MMPFFRWSCEVKKVALTFWVGGNYLCAWGCKSDNLTALRCEVGIAGLIGSRRNTKTLNPPRDDRCKRLMDTKQQTVYFAAFNENSRVGGDRGVLIDTDWLRGSDA